MILDQGDLFNIEDRRYEFRVTIKNVQVTIVGLRSVKNLYVFLLYDKTENTSCTLTGLFMTSFLRSDKESHHCYLNGTFQFKERYHQVLSNF